MKIVTVTIVVVALATGLAACGNSATPAVQAAAADSFERYSFTNAAGTRTYKVFIPAGLAPGAPLIVELHGCGGNADEEARWSRLNAQAKARGMLIAYPEQDPNANGSRCWNWFLAEHQERDAGEPAIIAGITQEVIGRWGADPARVYVGGISAGGAMSNIMAITWPDLYAAAMVYAGCQYKGGASCLEAQGTLTDEQAGQVAHDTMGANARVVPVFVIHGDTDELVRPQNGEQVVQQHLANDDLVDDGVNNGSVAKTPATTENGSVPGGHTYSVDTYRDGSGCVLAQRWLVNGMRHAWSNGESNGSTRDQVFTDPQGPDVTTPMVAFFLSHPMPADRLCHQLGT